MSHARKTLHVLYREVWKTLDELHREVWKALDELPLPGVVSKPRDNLNIKIRQRTNHPNLEVRKALHDLHLPAETLPPEISVLRDAVTARHRAKQDCRKK